MSENATETTATKPEPMDLSFLAKTKSTKATIAPVTRGRKAAPNPVAGHYQESLDTVNADGIGDARSIKVTAGVATRVESLLRAAAFDAKYGITIQMQLAQKVQDPDADTVSLEGVKELEPETPVWVAFQAKPKQIQNRKPKSDAATESPEDTPAN
jgi:hypothetical protein